MEYRIHVPWSFIIAVIVAIVIICVIVFRIKRKNKESDQHHQNFTDNNASNASLSDSQPIFCPHCGIRLNSDANYCSNCGREVE